MSTSKPMRVGVYGGTFSPPHNGHVHAAKCFLEQMDLDRLILIPAGIPPHKTRMETTSSQERLQLCRAAFSFSEKVEISDMEIKREGKSYTVDTLTLLKAEDRELFFLCGTDMLLTMDAWRDPAGIFKLAHIVCLAREAEVDVLRQLEQKAEEYRQRFGASVFFLTAPPVPMSSSEVRDRIQKGREWESAVPAEVARIIREKGLYQ
ncbi:MAG: nicotinate-nucleotide adenylyltransferase [Clostridia bacterium]|nr:nicotinate-nucleotide adenylyltransferase [Clostridia bacterium]